jgi:hypothetical protein
MLGARNNNETSLTRDWECRVIGIGTVLFRWEIIDVETVAFRLSSWKKFPRHIW